jgi:retinol dehydrogenase 12
MESSSLLGKTILLTGATSGIGRIMANKLAGMGASLILVGRNTAKGDQLIGEISTTTGNEELVFLAADLSSMDEVHRLASEINSRTEKIDVLINNAGAVFFQHQLSTDGYEMSLALNHLSPFLLTNLIMDRIKAAPAGRIITTSSIAHQTAKLDFDDLMLEKGYKPWTAYSNSKLANILFTYQLGKNLAGSNCTANTLHPGFVRTNFGRSNGGMIGMLTAISQIFAISPEAGASTSIYLASSPDVEGVTGKYFVRCKPVKSSEYSYNETAALQLWAISLKLTGLA